MGDTLWFASVVRCLLLVACCSLLVVFACLFVCLSRTCLQLLYLPQEGGQVTPVGHVALVLFVAPGGEGASELASIETAAQQNKTSMETRTKAEAANMAALKASIDTLNANVVQAEKMTKIRWAYDHATIGQHYTNSTTVQTILLAFMMEKGKYTDEITTNEEHLKKTIDQLENMLGKRPVIRPANGKNALFYD